MKHLLLLHLACLASTVSAQVDHASSDGYVAIAPSLAGAAGLGSSAGLDAAAKLTFGFPGVTLTSAEFVAHVGTAAIPSQLAPGVPMVFGVLPAVGDRMGGEALAVAGFGFEDGSGTAQVSVGGAPASAVVVGTNTVLQATSGPGVNAFGNPLGRVDVAVANAAGSGVRSDAYVYMPALDDRTAPRVAKTWLLDLHLPAGSFYQLALGGSIPGLAFPVPPLTGAAEILSGLIQLTPLTFAPTELVTLPLPIPANPALAGLQLELQAAVLTALAPLAGTFTNRLVTVVGP